jgi:transposase
MATRKRHMKEFKLAAVRLLTQSGRPGAEVARELGIRRSQLYKWANQLKGKGRQRAFLGSGPRRAARGRTDAGEAPTGPGHAGA